MFDEKKKFPLISENFLRLVATQGFASMGVCSKKYMCVCGGGGGVQHRNFLHKYVVLS